MADSGELSGRTALVTGGAKRLGAATALALAEAGANVAIHYRNSSDDAEALAMRIRALGVKAYLFRADFEEDHAVDQLMDGVLNECGALDILVNNASIFPGDELRYFLAESLHANINTNALAPCLLTRIIAEEKRPAAIVNLLDTMIADYDKKHVAYHLSKRMLYSLTRMMAVEFAPLVRVNAVAPGLILAPVDADAGYLERLASSNPMNTHGDAADVTDAILFLLRSRFITGQVIFVDGGRHLKGSMYG